MRSGFPVPAGFVITTAAYRAFVARHALGATIEDALRGSDLDGPAACEAAAAVIRRRFAGAPLPPELAVPIRAAHQGLVLSLPGGETTALAVRSSATAEDLPAASFAGQQETVLGVRGGQELHAAVLRCWSSLWGARALAYRARRAVDASDLAMAVVVQVLVPAACAGVLFTADPVSGSRERVVINAAWGLGEPVVSGSVTPDVLVLDKTSGRILSRDFGDRRGMLVAGAGGVRTVSIPPRRRSRPVLSRAQAVALARLGTRIEEALGGPQDIEWAMARGRLWVLQSRPVTARGAREGAPGMGEDWAAPVQGCAQPFDLWTRLDVGERWPDPVTPLTWTFYAPLDQAVFRGAFRDVRSRTLDRVRWTGRFYGRAYLNQGALVHASAEIYGMPRAVSEAIVSGNVPDSPPTRRGWHPWRLLRRSPGMAWLAVQRLRAERTFLRLFPDIEAQVQGFQARELRDGPDGDLWLELARVWRPRCARAFRLHADISVHAGLAIALLDRFLGLSAAPRRTVPELLGGLSGVDSADMVPALWALAGSLAALAPPPAALASPTSLLRHLRDGGDSPAAQAWLDAFGAFLARHGHRCPHAAELLHPRWAEAPAGLIEAILAYLPAPGPDPAEAAARQRRAQAQAVAAVSAGLPPALRAPFRLALRRTQHLVRLRDNGQDHAVQLLLPVRRLLARLGAAWAERGWLGAADDVFFLTVDELARLVEAGSPEAAGLDLAGIGAARRAWRRHWEGTAAPAVLGPEGRPVGRAPGADAPGALTGVPASPGCARGPARVVTSFQAALAVPRGSILVTRATDPGWTPVFPNVAGLVLEIGGTLSHGAIVAREYGLPAVVGVARATERIRDGQFVTVDGTSGRVELGALPGEPDLGAPDPGAPAPEQAGAGEAGPGEAVGPAVRPPQAGEKGGSRQTGSAGKEGGRPHGDDPRCP